MLAEREKATASDTHPPKLVACPFEVRVDGASHDRFYDVRDAMMSARALKKRNPSATVLVVDTRTRKLVIEIDLGAPTQWTAET
jgi:hypothetical protein